MSENYLATLERRLDTDIDAVINGNADRGEFVHFVLEEVRASFTRGIKAGKTPYKKSPRKKAPFKR